MLDIQIAFSIEEEILAALGIFASLYDFSPSRHVDDRLDENNSLSVICDGIVSRKKGLLINGYELMCGGFFTLESKYSSRLSSGGATTKKTISIIS